MYHASGLSSQVPKGSADWELLNEMMPTPRYPTCGGGGEPRGAGRGRRWRTEGWLPGSFTCPGSSLHLATWRHGWPRSNLIGLCILAPRPPFFCSGSSVSGALRRAKDWKSTGDLRALGAASAADSDDDSSVHNGASLHAAAVDTVAGMRKSISYGSLAAAAEAAMERSSSSLLRRKSVNVGQLLHSQPAGSGGGSAGSGGSRFGRESAGGGDLPRLQHAPGRGEFAVQPRSKSISVESAVEVLRGGGSPLPELDSRRSQQLASQQLASQQQQQQHIEAGAAAAAAQPVAALPPAAGAPTVPSLALAPAPLAPVPEEPHHGPQLAAPTVIAAVHMQPGGAAQAGGAKQQQQQQQQQPAAHKKKKKVHFWQRLKGGGSN